MNITSIQRAKKGENETRRGEYIMTHNNMLNTPLY